jgi:hypothetical protein
MPNLQARTTMSATIILTAMLNQPPAYVDRHESREERAKLLAPYAHVIDKVGRNIEEKAALVAQGLSETQGARYVLEGRCHEGPRGQRCDEGRARGFWQVHPWCKATTIEGEARCVLSIMRSGKYRCQTGWLGAFSATKGLAGACSADWARKRVSLMQKIRASIWKGMK